MEVDGRIGTYEEFQKCLEERNIYNMQEEFSEIMNKLSEDARFALQKSDYYAKRYNNGYMSTEHLLLGIMSMDTSTGAKMLREEGVTTEEVEKALNKTAVEVPGSDMAMIKIFLYIRNICSFITAENILIFIKLLIIIVE